MAQRSTTAKIWAVLSPVLVVVALAALSRVRLEVPRVVIEPPVIATKPTPSDPNQEEQNSASAPPPSGGGAA